jgi:hypothetical protein
LWLPGLDRYKTCPDELWVITRVAVVLQGMGNEMYNVSWAPFMMENSGEHEHTTLFSASFALIFPA